MFKILFVNLSTFRIYDTPEKRPILEPLWAECLDSIVNKYFETKIIDTNYQYNLGEILESYKPNFVLISITTPLVKEAKEVISLIRNLSPNSKIIIGGPHVSALKGKGLDFDFAVIGEGEEAIMSILRKETKEKIIIGNLIKDLDSLPYPTRIDRSNYYLDYIDQKNKSQVLASIISSRSCPWNCIYCASKTTFGKKLRLRSPKNILDELEYLKEKHNVNSLIFLDDCFTALPKRVEELCNGMIDRKLNMKWWIDTRCDRINKELLELMKNAGCSFIVFGVESGSESVLKRIKKDISLTTIRNAFKIAHEVGINTKCNIMIGHIDETEEEILQSIQLTKDLGSTKSSFYKVIPLPGSELYDICINRGLISEDMDFSNFAWYKTPPNICKVSSKRLDELQKYAYQIK